MKYCYYLRADESCGVSMIGGKANCPCEDYTTTPDPFWEMAGHDLTMNEKEEREKYIR